MILLLPIYNKVFIIYYYNELFIDLYKLTALNLTVINILDFHVNSYKYNHYYLNDLLKDISNNFKKVIVIYIKVDNKENFNISSECKKLKALCKIINREYQIFVETEITLNNSKEYKIIGSPLNWGLKCL